MGAEALKKGSLEMNRFSADLCTSVIVSGGLPRAIPVSAIPKIHTKRKRQIEYNI
jgi:hypothetical protein